MEAIQGFAEWHKRGITPTLGLLMWYLESVQREDGSFLRTEDATLPSIGVAVRYLQIAGQLGIHRGECESVDRGARWLEDQIGDDGLIRMPVTGLVDFGMLARTIRSLNLVSAGDSYVERLGPAFKALNAAQLGSGVWPTYPDGEPSTGATSLAIVALANRPESLDVDPDPTWLLDAQNDDRGWGEFAGSPSRSDNTFWAVRACLAAGTYASPTEPNRKVDAGNSQLYDEVMIVRERCLFENVAFDTKLLDRSVESLTDETDRYAATALLGLALCEMLQQESDSSLSDETLPVRTPEFIRREPPLYDQLAETVSLPSGMRLVEWASTIRLAEGSVGWLAGLSAAIALIGEELVNGLASLSTPPLIGLLILGGLVVAGWLAAQQRPSRRFHSIASTALRTSRYQPLWRSHWRY